jgi:demethylspheroidene O-methyltransferase
MSIEDVAARADLTVARAQVLIDAAVAIELLSRRKSERVGLGTLGAAIVANPGISAMILHHAMLYGDLSDPVALLRADRSTGQIRQFWSYAGGGGRDPGKPEEIAEYSALMAESQHLIASDIMAAVPFTAFRRVLDVGGGDGTFLATLARAIPKLEGSAFDLPGVADLAEKKFERAGLRDRCAAVGGDFLVDPLPSGFDALTLVRVLHDHDDDAVIRLLCSARRSIERGGTIVIAEPMSGVRSAAVVADAYFGFYLLAMGSGRPRCPGTISRFLKEAGFSNVRHVATRRPLLVSASTAKAT